MRLSNLKYLLFAICAAVMFACKTDKSDFDKMLLSNKWLYYPYDKPRNKISFVCYRKFYDDNTLSDFYLISDIEYSQIDGERPEQIWDYNENKKEFKMSSYNFKILSIGNDTVKMRRMDNNSRVCLIKYKPQKKNDTRKFDK